MDDYTTSARRLRRAERYRASTIVLGMTAGAGLAVLIATLIALALSVR